MERIGSDRENVSETVWLLSHRQLQVQWYCIDVAEENLFIQKEVRLSRTRKLIQLESSDNNSNNNNNNCSEIDEEEVVPITFPPGELGLRIQPHSICHGINPKTTCVLGSSIYCSGCGVGNRPDEDQDLCCLDTTDLHSGWRNLRMNTGRLCPQMAALDGKLYIFGGPRGRGYSSKLGLDNREGEVFDPHTGQSESIPPMPLEFEGRLIFITVHAETKQIVFFSGDSMVYYDVKNQNWIIEHDPAFRYSPLRDISTKFCRGTTVGTTVYCFSNYASVFAYDFSNRKLYNSSPLQNVFKEQGFIDDEYRSFNAVKLLHLRDDYFCLVWGHDDDWNGFRDPQRYCRCTKLQISIDKDSESLSLSVSSTKTYLLNFDVTDALVVNTNMEQTIGRRSGIISEGEDNSIARESKCKQLIVSAQDCVTHSFKLDKIADALKIQTSQTHINWNYFPEKLKAMEYRQMYYKKDEPWENENEIDELKVKILEFQNFIQAIENFSTELQEEKSKLKNIIEEIKILCNGD